MKKILVTRKLLRSCEDKASKLFNSHFNSNDELYSQKKLIELSKGCDGILSSLTDKIDEETIKNKLSSNKKFVWLKRNITPFEQQKIIDLGEINLEFHNEKKRIYPFMNTSSHLVGFVNIDQIGQRGIERYFNKSLNSLIFLYVSFF